MAGLLSKSEERIYTLTYETDEQIRGIEKRLAELSGIYKRPIRTTGMTSSQYGTGYTKIEHTWATKSPPYIEFHYNPFVDGDKELVVKSNIVTTDMVEKIQKELGLFNGK